MTTLAIIDIPNIDMSLSTLLGRKPRRCDRPDWAEVRRWLTHRSGSGAVEAVAFTNVSVPACASQQRWLHLLRTQGYAVFAKPRISGSDVDDDMLHHLHSRVAEGDVGEVLVFSHDAANFAQPIQDLVRSSPGPSFAVVGFQELAGHLAEMPAVAFIDFESISGAFSRELPRTPLLDLPEEGQWFEPLLRVAA